MGMPYPQKGNVGNPKMTSLLSLHAECNKRIEELTRERDAAILAVERLSLELYKRGNERDSLEKNIQSVIAERDTLRLELLDKKLDVEQARRDALEEAANELDQLCADEVEGADDEHCVVRANVYSRSAELIRFISHSNPGKGGEGKAEGGKGNG
jgi:hypothetical protein